MRQRLPKEIEPFRFAHQGIQLDGQLTLSELPRLSDLLVDTDGVVDVDMLFGIDLAGTPFMKGMFKTTVRLVCERCLHPLQLPLNIGCLLGLVRHEHKIEGLSEQYEPWVIEDTEHNLVDPRQVVEDEIILSLPLIPKHEHDCLPKEALQSGENEIEVEKPASPFAILATLKTKK